MIYHVLPGDAVAAEFAGADIEGKVIVCRECLIVGPVDAVDRLQFWDERAGFILREYGEDEIEYKDRVAGELERVAEVEADDEVNLWFEYELFCQTNLWFCVSLAAETGAEVYRVAPSVLATEERWQGFGRSTAEDLRRCCEERTRFTEADLKLGCSLWQAYSSGDRAALRSLGQTESPCFPYLSEVIEAELEKDERPVRILQEIKAEGKTEFPDIFAEFTRRAGVYGFGDIQVERLLEKI